MLKNIWIRKFGCFTSSPEPDATAPFLLTDNFYQSAYLCPQCNGVTYKTVFPIGKEFRIETVNGIMFLKRVFTCHSCGKFFAPMSGQKLSAGSYMELTLPQNEYRTCLLHMSACGSTVGRADA